MINGEILKAVKTARAVFHPLSKARKTELRSCFSGAFKLSGLSCKKEQVQRAKEEKYKGLPKSSPNNADNTKTNIAVAVAAEVVVAIRGTAVSRIVEPRPAPQYSASCFVT